MQSRLALNAFASLLLVSQLAAIEFPETLSKYSAIQISDRSPKAIAAAANDWLKSLESDLKSKAMLPMSSAERAKWSNLPPNPSYAGVRLGDLSEEQARLALDLVATSLSSSGFDKSKGIMLGDDKLVKPGSNEGRFRFGSPNYWLLIFGDPNQKGAWSWQLDGHHLAVNATISGEKVRITPSFIGTQPADFTTDGVRYLPMKNEVKLAYQLIGSLNPAQKAEAVVGSERQTFKAGPGQDSELPEPEGLLADKLDPTQRRVLMRLISQWINDLPPNQASERILEIKDTLPQTQFCWAGETKKGSYVYYRIQGPKVFIEFSHQNLGGDPSNHLHSVYRNPGSDYQAE